MFDPRSPRHWGSLLVVLALGGAVHLQSLAFDFSHFDDDRYVIRRTAELSNLANAPKLFREGLDSYFRPLMDLSFMLDTRAPLSPAPFHRTDVLLHLAACALFFVLLLRLEFGTLVAFFAAALFAVHPVAVSAVDWIPGRDDSLLACFFLASWLALLAWRRSRSAVSLLLHLLFLLAALLSKETAVALVPIFVAFDWAVPDREAGKPLYREPPVVLGWVVVLSGWWLWRESLQLGPLSPNPEVFQAGRDVLVLLGQWGKAVLPLRLSPFANAENNLLWPGAVGVAAVVVAIWGSADRRFALAAAGAVLMLLLPTLAAKGPLLLECRLYAPLLGLLLLAASFVRSHPPRTPAQRAATSAVVAAAVALLGMESVAYGRDYRDSIAFGEACVRTAPTWGSSYYMLGKALLDRGDQERAEQAFRKTLALDPKEPLEHFEVGPGAVHLALGSVLYNQQHYPEASAELLRAIELDPLLDGAYLELGLVRAKQGNHAEAVAQLERAVELNPNLDVARMELGVVLYQQGSYPEAAVQLGRALELNPDLAGGHLMLGFVRQRQGRYDEAAAELRRAIALNPDLERAHLALGLVRREQGRYAEAVAELSRAVELEPGSIRDLSQLYATYRDMGDTARAEQVEAELRQRGYRMEGDVPVQFP